MELELKAREYENLCKKLEETKQKIINENDENLLLIKEEFKRNYEEIIKINKQLKQLKNIVIIICLRKRIIQIEI